MQYNSVITDRFCTQILNTVPDIPENREVRTHLIQIVTHVFQRRNALNPSEQEDRALLELLRHRIQQECPRIQESSLPVLQQTLGLFPQGAPKSTLASEQQSATMIPPSLFTCLFKIFEKDARYKTFVGMVMEKVGKPVQESVWRLRKSSRDSIDQKWVHITILTHF